MLDCQKCRRSRALACERCLWKSHTAAKVSANRHTTAIHIIDLFLAIESSLRFLARNQTPNLESIQICIDFPGGDLLLELVPLFCLYIDVPLKQMLTKCLLQQLVFLQLIQGFQQ